MLIGIQDELLKIESLGLLDTLLQDKTTRANIIWATDAYAQNGDAYQQDREIISGYITGVNSNIIKTRVRKELEEQSARTKQHAEVFTPMWVCKMMNDYVDEMWSEEHGELSEENWREYVDSKRMEITCGEAPFLVSRYDASTGEAIPIEERIGILDRKLKVVGEYAKTDDEWLKWALRAFQATYGYEFQGDNVLIARVNLLMTYEEYFDERFGKKPSMNRYKKIADIISWNIWQMDGLSGGIPFSKTGGQQLDVFEMLNGSPQTEEKAQSYCMIYDWVNEQTIEYKEIAERNSEMKFDYIIGNPPYQDETIGDNKTYAPPIYDKFLESAYKISNRVEMIHPARFLFNAGSTPKEWNRKMLDDPHLKVLWYEAKSSNIFPNTDIKGGVAVTYRDVSKNYGKIGIFTKYVEINSILGKILNRDDFKSFSRIVYSAYSYHFTEKLHEDFPDAKDMLSEGHAYDLKSNVLKRLPDIFHDEKPDDFCEYVQILGRDNNQRIIKFVRRDYIKDIENLDSYKVILAGANGAGTYGEILSAPIIGNPLTGTTESFVSIGKFDTEKETEACIKYIKSRFTRALLGVLKVTQNITPEKWKYVPMQDFSDKSDIDWSKTVAEIDKQLYKKYRLDENEIEFIEKNVKEME